jgi:hypothetical protein
MRLTGLDVGVGVTDGPRGATEAVHEAMVKARTTSAIECNRIGPPLPPAFRLAWLTGSPRQILLAFRVHPQALVHHGEVSPHSMLPRDPGPAQPSRNRGFPTAASQGPSLIA